MHTYPGIGRTNEERRVDLNLKKMLDMGRRWWWLIVLVTFLAGGSAYYTVSKQTKMYAATATVEINPPTIDSSSTSYYDTNIVATYRALITTSSVLQPYIDSSGIPYDIDHLRDK